MLPSTLNRFVLLVIVLLSVLMTIKYYPGLENEPAYAGNTFQTIHADAFVGDPYRSPEQPLLKRPLQLSLFYIFPKLLGEIWLDDRFLVFVYIGLVIAGLVGIDRLAVLFGLRGIYERGFVLLFFAKDHQILSTKVLLAHHQDVNHSAFSLPVIVWLFYVTVARKSIWVVLAVSLLLTLVSIRAAFFPIVSCLLAIAFIGTRFERNFVIGLFCLGSIALAGVLVHQFGVPDIQRLELWDFIKTQEGDDANPFVADSIGYWWPRNILWIAIIGGAIAACRNMEIQYQRASVLLFSALGIWLIGGLYITFSPDIIKAPLLIGFAPTRATAWPQNLAYVILLARALRMLANTTELKQILLVAGGLGVLFVAGPGNLDLWIGLLGISTICVLGAYALYARTSPATLITGSSTKVMALTLATVIVIAYSVASLQMAPAWATLIRHGVYGNTTSAEWIGVAEYFRYETPQGTRILPYHCQDKPECRELIARRGLATRSGKAIIVPEVYGHDFMEPASWRRYFQQLALIENIAQEFKNGEPDRAAILTKQLLSCPDYVTVPAKIWNTASSKSTILSEQTRIRGHVILKQDCPE